MFTNSKFGAGFGFGAESGSIDTIGLISATTESQTTTFDPYSIWAENALFFRRHLLLHTRTVDPLHSFNAAINLRGENTETVYNIRLLACLFFKENLCGGHYRFGAFIRDHMK